MLELILGAALIFIFFIVIAGLALYLLLSYSLYTMAQNKGLENPWFAFIPILQMYTLGKLVGTLRFQSYTISFPSEWILLIASAATIVLSNNFINFLAYLIFILAYYNVFMLYKQDRAVVYTIVGALIPVTIPFFLFTIRNNTPIQPQIINGNDNNNVNM